MLQLCKLCLMLGLCDYAKKQCWHNRAAPSGGRVRFIPYLTYLPSVPYGWDRYVRSYGTVRSSPWKLDQRDPARRCHPQDLSRMRQITGKMRDECSQRRVCPRVLTGQVLAFWWDDIIIPRLPSSRGTLRPPQEFWDFWFGHLRNFGISGSTVLLLYISST